MSAKKVDRLDSKNFDDYYSGYVNHIAKWDGAAWKALYIDSNDEQETKEKKKFLQKLNMEYLWHNTSSIIGITCLEKQLLTKLNVGGKYQERGNERWRYSCCSNR